MIETEVEQEWIGENFLDERLTIVSKSVPLMIPVTTRISDGKKQHTFYYTIK